MGGFSSLPSFGSDRYDSLHAEINVASNTGPGLTD